MHRATGHSIVRYIKSRKSLPLLTIFKCSIYILTGSLTGQFLCEKRIPLFVTDPSLTKSLIRLTTEKWFTDYRRIFLVPDSAAVYDLNSFYRRRKHAHPSAQMHYWRSYRNKFYYIFKIRYK